MVTPYEGGQRSCIWTASVSGRKLVEDDMERPLGSLYFPYSRTLYILSSPSIFPATCLFFLLRNLFLHCPASVPLLVVHSHTSVLFNRPRVSSCTSPASYLSCLTYYSCLTFVLSHPAPLLPPVSPALHPLTPFSRPASHLLLLTLVCNHYRVPNYVFGPNTPSPGGCCLYQPVISSP